MGWLDRWRKAKHVAPDPEPSARPLPIQRTQEGSFPFPVRPSFPTPPTFSSAQSAAERSPSQPPATSPAAPTRRGEPGIQRLNPTAQWAGPGTRIRVGAYELPGGMLYVGRGLRAPSGDAEPALINPGLGTDTRSPDHRGGSMDYWPSYAEITPQARSAYLMWLADGRRQPSAYIGYVFLFFYGLERRVLVDILTDSSLRWELPLIRAEVRRLLDIYGANTSFRGYAGEFLQALDLLAAAEDTPRSHPPALSIENHWQVPMSLSVELGSFASDAKPVPAEWALAWAWYHPEIRLRTPATRCIEQFATLFKLRYSARYGDGLVVRPGRARIGIDYFAASPGIRSATLSMQIPDVVGQPVEARALGAIIDSVTDDLDPYSRFVGRNPDSHHSLAAAALLPAELVGESDGEIAALRSWASALAEHQQVVRGAEVMDRWPVKSAERMAKAEQVALAQLLNRFDLGFEPDVRLGGPAISPTTPVVVFRTGRQPPSSASPAYGAATTLLHLATAVAAADGTVQPEEQAHLVNHLESSLELSSGERSRLAAHLRWLTVNGVKLTGLSRRVEQLSSQQRHAVGDLLVAIAAADGVISAEEITSLTKIFKLLALDPADVHSRIHAHLSGKRPAPASTPITVREGRTPDPGYPIAKPASKPARIGVALDAAAVEAKFAETVAVSALLADIFDDEPATHDQVLGDHDTAGFRSSDPGRRGVHNDDSRADDASVGHGAASVSSGVLVAGLDETHTTLLRALAQQPTWARGEFTALAAQLGLLPDGALDRINDAAIDACDEPLLEEDELETLTLNDYARQELLP